MTFDFSNLTSYISNQFKDIFLNLINGEYSNRNFLFYGGRGSSKSYLVAQILTLYSFIKKGNALVVQSTYSAMKEASFAEITEKIEIFGLNDYFTITTSPLLITNNITGNKIIFRGCDNPMKLKSIKGISTVFFEEADLIQEEMVSTIDLSARGFANTLLFFCFNPGSPYTYLKKYIDDPNTYNFFIHKSYYYDNEFLDSSFIKNMELLKINSPEKYERDGLGNFTQAEGLCINNELIHDISYKDIPKIGGYEGRGIDFGFTHNQSFVHCKYIQQTNVLYIMEVVSLSGLTNSEFIDKIPNEHRLKRNCYADSASPDKIKQLTQHNFSFIGANKRNLPVGSFIEFMNQLNAIKVTEKATKFKIEAGLWSYVPDTDTPKKIDDDIMDALRYSLQPILLDRFGQNSKTGKKYL